MKTALITGASRGLGFELCRQLVDSGWKVAALSRSRSHELAGLEEVSGGRIRWLACDVTQNAAGEPVREACLFLGGLDLLVNNAGISGWSTCLADTEPAEVQALLDTHAFGCLRITRAAIPALLSTPNAHIVNVSSRLGSVAKTATGDFAGKGFSYSYRIAKAALNMASACLAEEFGPQGIRVSVLHPGLFQSGTASADASMSTWEAAARICRWLPTRDGRALVFEEPEAGALPW
jgi:NAD(P)-dependent dehydrogenase (short-subunit alcohol dehydrogenase family)